MRIYGLDILRSIAILTVVIVHSAGIIGIALPGFPYISLIDGVEIFFVLSGFLIGTILIKEYQKENFNTKSVLTFWKRRWFRTLPNYYLFLLINVILAYFTLNDNNIEEFNWKFLFFLHNFNTYSVGFFWESWSLSVEEWFYLLTPLFLLLFHFGFKKLKPNNYQIKKQTIFLFTILFFLITPFLYRLYMGLNTDVDRFWWDMKFRKVVTLRLDTIIYGVLGAYINYYYKSFWDKSKYYLLGLGITLYTIHLYINLDINSLYMKVFNFPFISLLVLCFIPFFYSIKKGKGIIYKAFTHISKISYTMYLLNLAPMIQVFNTNYTITTNKESISFFILYWILLLVISSIIYKYFEKPMTSLRDRF